MKKIILSLGLFLIFASISLAKIIQPGEQTYQDYKFFLHQPDEGVKLSVFDIGYKKEWGSLIDVIYMTVNETATFYELLYIFENNDYITHVLARIQSNKFLGMTAEIHDYEILQIFKISKK